MGIEITLSSDSVAEVLGEVLEDLRKEVNASRI